MQLAKKKKNNIRIQTNTINYADLIVNSGHEDNIATLQELAQELRMETEKIMGERARIKDMISNKGKLFHS